MEKKLIALNPEEVLKWLNYAELYIRPAFEKGTGETTFESLIGRALQRDAIFWMGFDEEDKMVGMASTEIMNFPEYRSVHLITIGLEDNSDFEDYHHFLETYAKDIGARDVQFWGRKGWSRSIKKVTGLNDEKYRETYRVFSMEIKYDE
jgi:hypothetical protein